jgi:2-amino-4-hydroxy-6-hydroxymethyldihydropteridine diphosphokinase
MPAPEDVVRAAIGLGSNLGNSAALIQSGFRAIGELPGTFIIARSSLWRSAPVGIVDQPDFINAVCLIDTTLDADKLLRAMLKIETGHDRVREQRGGPRTLDLDLLWYGNLVCNRHGLQLPHPRLHERAFVLMPLAEVDPVLTVPGLGTVQDLIAKLPAQRIEKLMNA